MWRQGDVFIQRVGKLPAGASQRPTVVLVEGEATGHAHRLRDRATACVYAPPAVPSVPAAPPSRAANSSRAATAPPESPGELFLEVLADEAFIDHEEHHPVSLPRGIYRVWRQREYSPAQIRTVID